ncbi:hypothetical protein D9611_012085 [Ephemerocybe angulata]|uniref:Uncharacterized protein n=1 Tax=Ephemerocybe angulata TaxID=980116 RepID=A0A8H5ES53_9AGAR|nr:hypothetical protein D9611_012085 [Tulosesus angulatus]
MYAPPRPRSRAPSRAPSPLPGYGNGNMAPPMSAPPSAVTIPSPYGLSSSPSNTAGSGYAAYGMPGGYHGGGAVSRPASSNEFRIEKVGGGGRSPNMGMRGAALPEAAAGQVYFDETTFKQRVAALVAAKDHQFAVTGRVVVDPTQLVLFFRSKSGITQSLDFPIDVDYNPPPALDVLVASCRPHQTSNYNDYMDRESLFYPPTLPLTISTDLISNYPILDAVRNALFPSLPPGHYLTAVKDKFELLLDGGRLERQPAHLRNDGRAATIVVTLPVRFQGGALVVRDPVSGAHERFVSKTAGRAGGVGEANELEWTAFLANCDYETEVVDKGYRVMLSYGVYIRNFSSEGAVKFQSLLTPTDTFFDLLAPIMNMMRGRTVGFHLSCDYADVDPSVVTADALIPQLRAGDYLLYHAFKMYKLTPNLHWAAGEYIWPLGRRVELDSEDITHHSASPRMPFGQGLSHTPSRPPVAMPPAFGPAGAHGHGAYGGGIQDDSQALRVKVEESGGELLSEADITVLKDQWTHTPAEPGAVERIPFISRGELKKLVVNVLLVVYIP